MGKGIQWIETRLMRIHSLGGQEDLMKMVDWRMNGDRMSGQSSFVDFELTTRLLVIFNRTIVSQAN